MLAERVGGRLGTARWRSGALRDKAGVGLCEFTLATLMLGTKAAATQIAARVSDRSSTDTLPRRLHVADAALRLGMWHPVTSFGEQMGWSGSTPVAKLSLAQIAPSDALVTGHAALRYELGLVATRLRLTSPVSRVL